MRVLSGRVAAAKVRQLARRGLRLGKVEPCVRRIIQDVRRNGDQAVRKYAEQFDGLPPRSQVRIPEEQIEAAWKNAKPRFRESLRAAERNVRQFATWQKPAEWQRTKDGLSVGQIIRPLDSVACYVPGGRYPLVSTVLMTVIPAQVAGVKRICITSPQVRDEILAAAGCLGIVEVYALGGAHAIAALAYGTETIPPVSKIVGPGNMYVAAAKKLVAHDCSIDFLAGPTEVAILSDRGRPEFIAADLVAQAEHDPEALAIFLTTDADLAASVGELADCFAESNRIARQALQQNGVILVAKSRPEAIAWANELAPEHITVDEADLPLIRNAGSIFIGDYSPQAAGDYVSGPNHVLPTGGSARFRGGLSVLDFMKLITVQKISRAGLRKLAPAIECLAQTEGLEAHAVSVQVRCHG